MTAMKHNHQSPRHPDLDAVLDGVPLPEADQLRAVWGLVGTEEPMAFPGADDLHQAQSRLSAALDAADGSDPAAYRRRSVQDRQPRARSAGRRRLVRWSAAMGTLLLLIGVVVWLLVLRPVTQQAPLGERVTVTLPDGSHVELNSGSSLHYARWFAGGRTVRLAGEAYFDVQAAASPFVVETFNAQVQVLGTRFGVRAWPERVKQGTTVALETGRLALAPAGQPTQTVTMEPGETRRVLRREVLDRLPDVTVAEATAWRRGDLFFKDQPLGDILDDVERRFAVDIEVTPGDLAYRRLNVERRQPESAEVVVYDLAMALGLQYRKTSTGFVLYAEAPEI